MLETKIIIYLSVAATLMTTITIGVFLMSAPTDWSNYFDTNSYKNEPPAPAYNFLDNDSCRENVGKYYLKAKSSFESNRAKQSKIDELYQKILDRQASRSFELVNNADFRAWTTSDWTDSWIYKQDNS